MFSSPDLLDFVNNCITFAREFEETQRARAQAQAIEDYPTISPTFSSFGFGGLTPSSVTSDTIDEFAVSNAEALAYYSGLPSQPRLVYRTGKKWTPPSGPEAQRRKKHLLPVYGHPIAEPWNSRELSFKVVKLLDDHKVYFTSIDVVRFEDVEVDVEDPNEDRLSPVTIWVGLFPGWTTATTAHKAAQAILSLLASYDITDLDVAFRESVRTREAGPQLRPPVNNQHSLVDLVGPLTPTLGLYLSTRARPTVQGTMALYLKEGDRWLGVSCRHVLIGSKEPNADYIYKRSLPTRNVLLLGNKAYDGLVESIKLAAGDHGLDIETWTEQIEGYKVEEEDPDVSDAEKAEVARSRAEIETLVNKAEQAIEQELKPLLDWVKKDWKTINNRVLGHVLRSPPIGLSVGEEQFSEDWAVFHVNKDKLGQGYKGNAIDLGTKMKPAEFTRKCFPRGDAGWKFKYPKDRLLPLVGNITDEQMRHPDMFDLNKEPCLWVVKNGGATGTTLGRANGIFSITREYPCIMSSVEWAIVSYDSNSEAFSAPGDSGSIIADIQGRIGGMLTGGSGNTVTSDMTYATPWWWLITRIQDTDKGFPNVYVA